MKKRWIAIFCILLAVLALGGVIAWQLLRQVPAPKEGVLSINGVPCAAPVTLYAGDENHAADADLPLLEVLKGLGAEVNRREDGTADMTLAGKRYRLNLKEPSLVQEGDSFNLIQTPPGGQTRYELSEGDVLLPAATLSAAFFRMELSVSVNVNYEASAVTIVDKE